MEYVFKAKAELAWFVLVSVGGVVMQAIANLDASAFANPKAWAIGLAVAAIRAAAGAVLAFGVKPQE